MVAQIGDLEIYTGIVILAMIAVWVLGSISNKHIVEKAFKQYKHVLANQFMEPGKLVKESNSHFFTYSTGRVRCSGFLTSIHLSPRQDFLSRFVVSWIWKTWWSTDRVELEILDADIDECITGFVCRKYMASRLTEKLTEISKLCKPNNMSLEGGSLGAGSSGLTGFTYLADAGGKAIGPRIFGKGSPFAPNSVCASLKSIHISGATKSIKVDLDTVPASEAEWTEIIEYVLVGILDSLSGVRLSESVKAEVTAQRNADAEKAAREAAEAAREEQKRKEREEKSKQLTAQDVERMNEKRRKKDMRRGRIML